MQIERIAFMSYVHLNDEIDKGYLTKLRVQLEGQLKATTGEEFTIFQDQVHIGPGHQWRARVEHYLSKSAFLIPILTPHFYKSEWCRKEFEYFRDVEKATRVGPRIIPIYYIDCRQMRDHSSFEPESMEQLMSNYQYADWRDLRIKHAGINTTPAVKRLLRIAHHIRDRLEELESVQEAIQDTFASSGAGPSRTTSEGSRGSVPGTPFDVRMLPYPKGVIGRESEVARVITGLTAPGGSHIVAIDGIEAIGKTTVAAIAIGQLYERSRFPGGIAVIQCTGITDPLVALRDALTRVDPERRPPAMHDEAGLVQEAHRLLDGRQSLIVLDDVESALDIVRVVDPLHAAGAALLLTSRNRLPVPTATSFTLTSLDKPDALDLLTPPSEDER